MLVLTLLTALQRGNYLNLFPVFGSGYKNILKASLESAYAYGGLEGIFLIYPFMRNKDKIKADSVEIYVYPYNSLYLDNFYMYLFFRI